MSALALASMVRCGDKRGKGRGMPARGEPGGACVARAYSVRTWRASSPGAASGPPGEGGREDGGGIGARERGGRRVSCMHATHMRLLACRALPQSARVGRGRVASHVGVVLRHVRRHVVRRHTGRHTGRHAWRPLPSHVSAISWSDASVAGWGVIVAGKAFWGPWNFPTSSLDICCLELMAAEKAIVKVLNVVM